MASIIHDSKYIGENLQTEVFSHGKWLRFAGFVLLLLGLATIIAPVMPVLHSTAIIAGLLATSGVVYIMHASAFWKQKWIGFSLHMLAGIIYIMAGYMFFIYPLANIQILAKILGVTYLTVGLFRITTAIKQGITRLGWSWTLVCGAVNILLAGFLLAPLTESNILLVGIAIGIELVFTGWALFRLGINARREAKFAN